MSTRHTVIPLCGLLLALWCVGAAAEDSPILKLSREPASLFDTAMFRLQSDFLAGRDYDIAWFKRQYKGIEFSLDIVMYWPSRDQIVIHRDIHAKADLSSCTIAIETLREDLTKGKGVMAVNDFIKRYFWHYREPAPAWLFDLKKSIYLVGQVYDHNAIDEKSQFFWCESRLDQEEVRIVKGLRIYR